MIRIDFSPEDLGRVTFATAPDPLWDAALAARALRDLPSSATARRWRRATRSHTRSAIRPLLELITPDGKFPDFLTPDLDGGNLEDALDRLKTTPAELIRAELSSGRPPRTGRGWLDDLIDDQPSARGALCHAVRTVNGALSSWSPVPQQRFASELALRSGEMVRQGVEQMLATLHPDVEWRPPSLLLHRMDPLVCSIDLAGRGLLLYPSAMIADCITLNVAGRRPMLVYPAADSLAPALAGRDHLADLIGRTRAAVLRSLGTGASTTQLARRIGISSASASEHTRVLRNAGLVSTHRAGRHAFHSLTPSGTRLIQL